MNNIFKERLAKLMNESNINQLGLAKELGITQSTLSRNINGVHRPKAEIVERLAKFFNVSADYLLGNSDVRHITPNKPTPTPSAKEQLSEYKLAFYNQAEEITEEQAQEVLKFIEFIKNRDKE